MTFLLPLLIRELYEFKNNFFFVSLFWILLPVLFHILLAIPFSNIIPMDMRYLNWSAGGIWVVTSGLVAFLQSADRIRKIQHESRQIEAFLKAPMTNLDLLIINVMRGFGYGLIQFVSAIIITSMLNNEYIGLSGILIITIQMLTLILHYAVLGTFFGMIIIGRMLFTYITLTLFLFTILGLGNFIPLQQYPESYKEMIELIPITSAFSNIKSVKAVSFGPCIFGLTI